MQDFDTVHPEDRSFKIGGEVFNWRPMHWREFGKMVDDGAEEAKKEEDAEKLRSEARARGEDVPEPNESVFQSFDQLITSINRYLEPDDVERFTATINDPAKGISLLQLTELRTWIQEVHSNRPTEQPLPSDSGRGSAARISRVA